MHKKPTEQSPDVQQPIIQPMIDEMRNPFKTKKPPEKEPTEKEPPVGPIHPPESAELDQDPGGGYNPDGTIPQP